MGTISDDLLADLFQHPGFTVLKERLQERKNKDLDVLARSILYLNGEVDQRAIDEKRGFWRGADWFLTETKKGASAFAHEHEESEQS